MITYTWSTLQIFYPWALYLTLAYSGEEWVDPASASESLLSALCCGALGPAKVLTGDGPEGTLILCRVHTIGLYGIPGPPDNPTV